MPYLHIFLDSPAGYELTKTELDIGLITKPYVDIAHCIRAGFWVSHALREWVRITIGFDQLGPFSLTLNPTTIRYLGTDERSILHAILHSQNAARGRQTKIPYGVSINDGPVRENMIEILNQDFLLLIPNEIPTWKEKIFEFSKVAMYCPLVQNWNKPEFPIAPIEKYRSQFPRDVAILEVVHALDSI
ncbi:MAG: hypothetical protein ACFFDU_04195 [Candidatus Thorarchaeota archaeon]